MFYSNCHKLGKKSLFLIGLITKISESFKVLSLRNCVPNLGPWKRGLTVVKNYRFGNQVTIVVFLEDRGIFHPLGDNTGF